VLISFIFRRATLAATSQLVPAGFSLAAVLLWGTSDFVGGYAVRRANAFLFTAIVHGSGVIFMLAIALLGQSSLPSRTSTAWALAAGLLGGISLAIFYRALAIGSMGLTAPVAAVLSAGIPAVVGIITQGLPGAAPVTGFVLAGLGIWLISRPEDGNRPQGLGWAILAGVGFAGFYLCIKQAGNGSALWIAWLSRVCSFVVTALIVLLGRNFRDITRPYVGLAVFAGCVDISGSALFVRASQTGRLDTAVVISSLYPAVTALLAWLLLKERLTRWKAVGMFAALLAVPLIALQ
jgi:drug/metabolite transporter (DMT)-like permease